MALLNRREGGMTLIELLVAMAILAVVILSVIGLFTQSITLNASGMDYTRINDLARDRVEELVGLPFDDPALLVPEGSDSLVIPDDLQTGGPTPLFTRVCEIRQVQLLKTGDVDAELATPVGASESNLKVMTVTVASGRSFLSGQRVLRFTALRADGLRY